MTSPYARLLLLFGLLWSEVDQLTPAELGVLCASADES